MLEMMSYSWWSMVLFPLAVLVIIVIGAYPLITEFSKTRPSTGGKAIRILEERYAKGEITREQFLEMKKELE